MEIQKKKETQWEIKKKDGVGAFKLKYYDDAGIITEIGIGLKDLNNEVFFEMTPLEFKNFVSVLKSFINLLYSEGLELMNIDILNTFQESKNFPNGDQFEENIDNTTEKEIENLRQIEAGTFSEHKSQTEQLEMLLKKDEINSDEIDLEQSEINSANISIVSSNSNENGNFKENELIQQLASSASEDIDIDENNNNINTDEIFKDIDEIIPTIENGTKNENSDNETPTLQDEEKKENEPEENVKKKNTLDPKDWDPW